MSGLDTLQLAQYTVEDHYTSVSEAVYETGESPGSTGVLSVRPRCHQAERSPAVPPKGTTPNWCSTLN